MKEIKVLGLNLKISDTDYWIGKDKIMHLVACFLATVFFNYQVGLILGIGKEFIDLFGNGASYKDLVWDAFGVCLGMLYRIVFHV